MKSYQKKSKLSREKILNSLREAQKSKPIASAPYPQENANSPVFFEYSPEELLEMFIKNFEQIQGQAHLVNSEEEAQEKLESIISSKEWDKVYSVNKKFTDWVPADKKSEILSEDIQASVTACDFMIARTGSLLITSALESGRSGTVYPPEHVVIAYKSQLLPDIGDALKAAQDYEELPSMINLNTGPSRTADIEKTLVVGIHGPKEVNLILINN